MRSEKLKAAAAALAAVVAVSASQKPAADAPDPSVRRAKSLTNLSRVAHAIHWYHVGYGKLPTDICDDKGRPLLSWRVELLPFLDGFAEGEGQHLFKQFKRDEPWDSANNKPLAAFMPGVYGGVGVGPPNPAGRFLTYVQRPTGANTFHEPGKAVGLADATDGTSNTLMLVEAAGPVDWTKPADLPFVGVPLRVTGPVAGYLNVAFGDGAVRSLKPTLSPDNARLLIDRRDGTVFGGEAIASPPTTDRDLAAGDRMKTEARAKFEELLRLMGDEATDRATAGGDPLVYWVNALEKLEHDRRVGELKARKAGK